MSSTSTEKLKTFKSKIPVPVLKSKYINKTEEKREIGKHIPYTLQTNKSALPMLKTQLVKPPRRQINKRSEVCKSQTSRSQHSNKTSVKNYSVSIEPKVKSFKENKLTKKPVKDILPELSKKVTIKKSVKEETKKAKPLAYEKYQSSNASLPTFKAEKFQIAGVPNGNKFYALSQNIAEKENEEHHEMSDFSAQKDIKFEANEIYRQMILRGRDLSPSVCRLAPGVKLSTVCAQRPSAYDTVFEVHRDPHYSAVQAIEKVSAKRANRKLTLPAEKMSLSPYKVRNSLYTPGVNPEDQVMKCLEAIRAKRMQKSALKSSQKKVTFNFNVEELSAKVELHSEQKSFADSEDKLTQINEASSENTPSSPVKNNTESNEKEEKNYLKPSKLDNLNGHGKSSEQSVCHERLKSDEESAMNTLIEKYLDILRPCETNSLKTDSNKTPFCSSKKTGSAYVNRNFNSKPMSEAFSCQKTVPKYVDKSKQRTTEMKLCTPRPISFSSNSRLLHNCSSDFSEERNVGVVASLAPIYTPLVLKNIAKSTAESPDNLSPVKLKLDFAATEIDTPKKRIPGKMQVSSVKNIVTTSKMLDNLADKECDIFLSDENCAVVCGRYLRNPVALTLTEGDEMHFLPIRL